MIITIPSMKQKTLFTILLILLPLSVFSRSVSQDEALRRAQAFMQQHGMSNATVERVNGVVHSRRAPQADASSDYYVFNIGDDEGFVIVSGDERTADILGYATSGSIGAAPLPDGLRYLLDGYSEQLAWMDDMGLTDETAAAAARSSRRATRKAVLPLLSTQWNQGTPYNNSCPAIDGKNVVTGCVATSMAQVMYYWKEPTQATTAIPGYTLKTKDSNKKDITLNIESLSPTSFSWRNMTPTYSASATGAAADAVAELMYYCGVSLQMHYGLSSSSAYNACIAEVLRDYFHYGTANYVQREAYTYEGWIDLIYTELASNRPVVFGGQSRGGGHSFVCDGYDTDDYFHINWGWGGTSDGYFRLSLLNPEEQGLGGSSTLDGFSYSQDAVVNISPTSIDGIANGCLSLSTLGMGSDGSTATTTVTRNAENNAFTGITIAFTLYNFKKATRSCDYAVQLTDDGGQVLNTLYSRTIENMAFNVGQTIEVPVTISAEGQPLSDGTYYIKVVSRPSVAAGVDGGEDEAVAVSTGWMECYGGMSQRIKAVVSGNTMTLTAPFAVSAVPTNATINVTGNKTKGYDQEVIASITAGASDYHGNLFLKVGDKYVMGKSVDISAGQTVDVRFAFTPAASGSNTLGIYTAKNALIGKTENVTILDSDATDDLKLDFAYTIHNLTSDSSTELYGNAFCATITVKNPSDTHRYVGQMNCSIRKWTSEQVDGNTTKWDFESIGVTQYPLEVEKNGGTTTIHITRDGLEPGYVYSARITYRRITESSTVADGVHIGLVGKTDDFEGYGSLTATSGYTLGDATGAITVHPTSEPINAGNASFVDLRNFGSLDNVSITTGSNPNCLYLLPERTRATTTPAALSDCNVVCGTTADNLTLTDGYDFFSPIAFTAANVSYTRTFTLPAAGNSGWNTLFLPFTATAVTCNDKSVDWFRSDSDTGKNFWLRAFTADADGSVSFGPAQELAANTPYIIAVPGDTWGADWKMTGFPVTFSATNADISATKTGSTSGNHYKFCGSTIATTLTNAYLLNATGSKFVKKTESVPPFRAWFEPVSISSLSMPSLTIGNAEASGIVTLPVATAAASANTIFTLSGVRLQGKPDKPGIYVMNGKKVVIK